MTSRQIGIHDFSDTEESMTLTCNRRTPYSMSQCVCAWQVDHCLSVLFGIKPTCVM